MARRWEGTLIYHRMRDQQGRRVPMYVWEKRGGIGTYVTNGAWEYAEAVQMADRIRPHVRGWYLDIEATTAQPGKYRVRLRHMPPVVLSPEVEEQLRNALWMPTIVASVR